MKEIITFVKHMIHDYKYGAVDKCAKISCYLRIFKNILLSIWSSVTAPFIYPIWYILRKFITKKIYKGTSWQEIEKMMQLCETDEVVSTLKFNGPILYWIWTYGDSCDPLGRGGMPNDYRNGKNNFWNRYMFGAFRNPRFNINYLYFRTGPIDLSIPIIDDRDFTFMHTSVGIGDSPDGIYFKWMKDVNDKWYFIYEDNNKKHLFYFGYVDLLKNELGKQGRFETSFRWTKSSYHV